MSSSHQTSKYFDTGATTTLPRRSTRANLASQSYKPEPSDDDVTFGSDIEDAVKPAASSPPPKGAVRRITAKRQRASTLSSPPAKKKIKPPPDSDSSLSSLSDSDLSSPESKPTAKSKPAPKPRLPKSLQPTTTKPPENWDRVYTLAKQMRLPGGAASNAAVDTMGCERLALATASPLDRRLHTLVSLMLSSQTKDTVNAVAMRRLQTELPPCTPDAEPGLNLANLLAVDPVVLNELIGKVGFHNNKTKYLKQAAEILRDKFSGDIPDTIEGMMSLPGVGPKMAHLCMAADNGWGRVEGIGVDVHVHRITNLWGWQKSKTPEETRKALESWLPKEKWKEINWLLVGLGQAVCLPVGRRCGECEVGLEGLCRAADRVKVNEGRRRRKDMGREVVEKTEVVEKKEEVGAVVKKEEEDGPVDFTTTTTKTEAIAVKDEVKTERAESTDRLRTSYTRIRRSARTAPA
ncbi:DNA glycosylase [Schizothecium vesticola]|uniref:Endonuclease III homolog n=1 Tax=Schizothecium vesticola TaxID=314040 RepID=A0AA40KB72_9PEZI|nr:DNA glycosylase [Schizothecium vesticola]